MSKLTYKKTSLALSDLSPHPKNPRIHSDVQIAELCRSIEMFGQIRDVVCNQSKTILAGHGIVMAMKKIGIKKANVLIVGGLTKKQEIKLLLADNKTQTLAADDFDALSDLIRDIGDYDIPGFDEKGLSSLFDSMEKAAEEFSASEPDTAGDPGDAPSVLDRGMQDHPHLVCPHCRKEFDYQDAVAR